MGLDVLVIDVKLLFATVKADVVEGITLEVRF